MKHQMLYFLICICIGCTTSKVGQTEICLAVTGIPSIVSDVKIRENSSPEIGVVQGKIMNRADSLPMRDVLIFSRDFTKEKEYYTTDENGEFEFEVSTGEYNLQILNFGNKVEKTIRIKNGETVSFDVFLGIGSSFTSFSTDNPKTLKKQIRRQNRERKRKYGI